MNKLYLYGTITLVLLLAAGSALGAEPRHSAGQWDDETLEIFGSIPIQDGGRIKPMSTFATFRLLSMNGMRALRFEEGGRLSALEWLLDCLFYPEIARDYKHFSVDNSAVVTNIGVTAHDLRDRYSYNELLPGRAKLFQIAQQVAVKEQNDRTVRESMTLNLFHNVRNFELLAGYMEFARSDYYVQGSKRLDTAFPDGPGLTLSTVLAHGIELREAVMGVFTNKGEVRSGEENEARALSRFLNNFNNNLNNIMITSHSLALFPPADEANDEWESPATIAESWGDVNEGQLYALASLERMVSSVEDPVKFKKELSDFRGTLVEQAERRGEYSKVTLEVFFYKSKFFFYAQVLFVLAFLMVAVSWFNVKSAFLHKATFAAVIVPWAILVTGITVRCVIQSRPPITTLYETILFITAVSVFAALFIEYANRQRIAIAVAAFLGAGGVFLANKYELVDKQDTMPSLVAVLDTNFWLATHVTIINVGYAAGALAAGLAHVFVFGRLFKIRTENQEMYRNITRMVYGTVCFGLLFSFIGTVLGGIWANYSWGRFWGWDPKENGAMMIVLCNLAILHARMGGYIRDMGIHLAAIGTGCVVAFSWWGVNLLGVGLHSYGFTSGIWTTLLVFWITEAVVVATGLGVLLRDRGVKRTPDKAAPA